MRKLSGRQAAHLERLLSVYHPGWWEALKAGEGDPAGADRAGIAGYLDRVGRALELFIPARDEGHGVTERGGDAVVAYFRGRDKGARTYYLMVDVSGFTKLLTFLTDRFGKQEAGDIMNMSILNRFCLNRAGALIHYFGGGADGAGREAGCSAIMSAVAFRAMLERITIEVRDELTRKLAGKPHQDEISAFISELEIKASAGVVAAPSRGRSDFYGRDHRIRITWGDAARHLAASEKVGGSDDRVSPRMAEVKGVGLDGESLACLDALVSEGWLRQDDFRLGRFGDFTKLVLTARGMERMAEIAWDATGAVDGVENLKTAELPAEKLIEASAERIERTMPYLQGMEIAEQVVRSLGPSGDMENLFGERASRVHETGILFTNFSVRASSMLDELAEAVHGVMNRYGLVYKFNIFPYGDFNLMATLGMDVGGGRALSQGYTEILWQCWRDLDRLATDDFGSGVRLRGGMSVGQCLQGPVGDNLLHNELTIIGPDCNLAARLVARALTLETKENTLVVAANCHSRLGHLIQPVEPFEKAELKGFSEPVPLYTASPRREHESPDEIARRLRSPGLVSADGRVADEPGQDKPLGRALGYLAEASGKSLSRGMNPAPLLAFHGPSGTGKTRRLAEIMHWASAARWDVYFTECLSWYQGTSSGSKADAESHGQTHSVPYQPFVRLLKEQVLGVLPHERGAQAAGRVMQRLKEISGGAVQADQARIFASFLGVESVEDGGGLSPEERRNIFFELVADMFERLVDGSEQAVLLVIDDFQWADSGTVSLLSYLRSRVGKGLVFCAAAQEGGCLEAVMPEKDDSDEGTCLLVELGPLEQEGSRMLARVALGLRPDNPLPGELDEKLGELENNPLFIVEYCRKLLDTGTVFVRDGELQRLDTDQLRRLAVPNRVQAVIEELVDSLPRGDYDVVRNASVLGNILRCRDVAELNRRIATESGMDAEATRGVLHSLAGRQVLEIEEDRGVDSLYRFTRSLIGQSLYQGLTPSLKKRLHAIAGELWEAVEENTLEKGLNCALHFELAEVPEKSAGYYLDSGRLAGELFENERVIELLGRVERFCSQYSIENSRRMLSDTFALRAAAALPLGQYEQALEDCEELGRLARRLSSRKTGLAALLQSARVFLIRAEEGDYENALESFRSAARRARGHPLLKMEADDGQARVLLDMGRLPEAMKKSRAVLRAAESSGAAGDADTREIILRARMYRTLGSSLMRSGRHMEAVAEIDRGLALLDKRAVFLPVRAQLLNSKGLALSSAFKLEEAIGVYYQARSLARRIGDVNLQLMILNNLSVSLNDSGKNTEALDLLVSSYDIIHKLAGESRFLAAFEFNTGECYHFMEDFARAERHYKRALEVARKIGGKQFAVNIMYNLGEALRDQGRTGEARRVLAEGVGQARELGYSQQEMDLENILGEMDVADSRPGEAIERHRHAAALAVELGDKFGESWSVRNLAVAMLEDGSGDPSEAAAMLERSLELAREVVQPENTMESLHMLLKYGDRTGAPAESLRGWLEELGELADRQNSARYQRICEQYSGRAQGKGSGG